MILILTEMFICKYERLFPFSGKCNTFCKVSMGSQEERTGVVSGSDCPLWDASMQFQVKDLLEDTLCITVFDKGYYSPDGNSIILIA
jgi:hypothetical protein